MKLIEGGFEFRVSGVEVSSRGTAAWLTDPACERPQPCPGRVKYPGRGPETIHR